MSSEERQAFLRGNERITRCCCVPVADSRARPPFGLDCREPDSATFSPSCPPSGGCRAPGLALASPYLAGFARKRFFSLFVRRGSGRAGRCRFSGHWAAMVLSAVPRDYLCDDRGHALAKSIPALSSARGATHAALPDARSPRNSELVEASGLQMGTCYGRSRDDCPSRWDFVGTNRPCNSYASIYAARKIL